jgi:hypothetical protein
MTHLFGIRHHGPGCARSLLQALGELTPDCVLIEGPPEAEEVLTSAAHAEMQPPVALLLYCPDDTSKASFYPFAEFSPEWQAIRYGLQQGLPVRFIDLPQAHDLALRDLPEEEEAEPVANEPALDPLGWIGRAAGYGDGESWWNHMVEERGDTVELFAAIQEVMTAAREELPGERSAAKQRRENLREAHMRKCIRQAEKDGFQRIAVICGAWHVPALAKMPTAKTDNDLLKGLPKVKVAATWAPWTYGRLAANSGYGAGVVSPGWYEFLWKQRSADSMQRAISWMSKVAHFMRAEDIDCSSAHVIEAARLSHTLAAMQDRPSIGLAEMDEAIRAVICMGDDAPLQLLRKRLVISEKMGQVPADVPAVPLQQDLSKLMRSLRMKPEALVKELDLDLRNENDLLRSQLLHRLRLLNVKWGEVRGTGRSSKGTFHEVWQLQWQPEFSIHIIEASRWGHCIESAATAVAIDEAKNAVSLAALSALVDRVLLAHLPAAVKPVTQALENMAAIAGDASQLLDALPPLANVFRYGNVRQTDASLVGHVIDSLVTRASISLNGACASLDDDAAQRMRQIIVKAHQAMKLIGKEEHRQEWLPALTRLAYIGGTHGLISGLAARLLFDEQAESAEDTALRMSQALSIGHDPAPAAAWLEGFLQQSSIFLIHDEALWGILDAWLAAIPADDFTRVLPLIRRSFSQFPAGERIQLGAKASHGPGRAATAPAAATEWNLSRAEKPLAVIQQILGL